MVGSVCGGGCSPPRRRERVTRAVIACALPCERMARIAVDEGGDGATLDAGFGAEPVGGGFHERQADDLAAFLLDLPMFLPIAQRVLLTFSSFSCS